MGTASNSPKFRAGQRVRVLVGGLVYGPELGIQGKSGVVNSYLGSHSGFPLDPGCSMAHYRVDVDGTGQHTIDEGWLEPISP